MFGLMTGGKIGFPYELGHGAPYEIDIHKHLLDKGLHAVMEHPCADQNGNIPLYKKMRDVCGWRGKYV